VVENDRSEASRWPVLTAHWEGGSRSRIEFGEVVTYIGGGGELNPMQALLAALAACDVDLVAMHAALLGITIESLAVEARGHFNVARNLGIDNGPGPGYDEIGYRVRLKAPGITEEQLALLRRRCELSSPVGDTLTRSVPVEFGNELEC
jgi:uncharacterized OsmC-like protein